MTNDWPATTGNFYSVDALHFPFIFLDLEVMVV